MEQTAVKPNVGQAKSQIGRRYRQLRKLWSAQGARGLAERLRFATAEYISPGEFPWPVDRRDVLAADLSKPPARNAPALRPDHPITLNWVTIPAAPKSGGHTTLFRIIRYLEARGYRNRVYFYNVYGADHDYYESIVRSFYGFQGQVGKIEEGMEDADGVIASAWATAYPVFNSLCAGKRFYFVQDYEPYFHPVGAISLLAENTYRMGFHAITAGKWLAQKLSEEFQMDTDWFDFGCDTDTYRRLPATKRSGLVFYARPEAARRGYELGLMAMRIFAERNPEIDLHFYGETIGSLPFRFINHGRITPGQLNQIYNQSYAGLSLSLTNVSLVPHEMLAAGCIPVVNEAVHNRMVLDNPYVRYTPPYPHALAAELEAIVQCADFETLSRSAAATVRGVTWDDAGASVDRVFRRVLRTETDRPKADVERELSTVHQG
jgi:glycosyltransferase involved in cell wall biosynthesis